MGDSKHENTGNNTETIEEVNHQFRRLKHIKQYIKDKSKYLIIGAVTGIVLAGSAYGYFSNQTKAQTLYEVYLDDQKIGTVDSKEMIDKWQSQKFMMAESRYSSSIALVPNGEISYIELISESEEPIDNNQILKELDRKFSIQAKGVELVVDGEVVGIVKDKETAEKVLSNLKEAYAPTTKKNVATIASLDNSESEANDEDNSNVEIKNVAFKEQVETKQINTNPDSIMDEETLITLLQKGTLEEKKYTVQSGDTISEIAVNFDLSTDQVYQLNPKLEGTEIIQIGDELTVTALKPKITVESEETLVQIEGIPFHDEYKKDNSMFVNEKKVIQSGKEGKKEVKYSIVKENGIIVERKVLEEKVLSEPVNRIYLQGTKIVPVRGSGQLMWPTVGGYVTSGYGPRWGSFHSALDISGVKDRTIKAADNGRIIYTGWRGGYGKAVMIDHGNGIVTLYGHLSSISVNVGNKVAKGQKIGVMGSTGNSTGVHLHFEVRVNGQTKNPLNYVGR